MYRVFFFLLFRIKDFFCDGFVLGSFLVIGGVVDLMVVLLIKGLGGVVYWFLNCDLFIVVFWFEIVFVGVCDGIGGVILL